MALYVNTGERTGSLTIVKTKGQIDADGHRHAVTGVKVYPDLAWLPGMDASTEPGGPECVDTEKPSPRLQQEAEVYWGEKWKTEWVKAWEKVAKRHNYVVVDKDPRLTREIPVKMTVEQARKWKAENQPNGPAMDQEVVPQPNPTGESVLPMADEDVLGENQKSQKVHSGGRGVSNKGK